MSDSNQQADWKHLFELEKQNRKTSEALLENKIQELEKQTTSLTLELNNSRLEVITLKGTQQELQDLIATSGEYTWETDQDFHICDISSRAALSLGYSIDELIGLPLATALNIDSDGDEHGVDFFAQLFKNKTAFREQILKCRDEAGSPVWQKLNGEPIVGTDNTFLGFRGTGSDVTEAQEAKEKAKRAEKEKSVFLSKISHDVRPPLNGIIGMSKILIETNLQDNQQGYVLSIQRSADALISLINQIFSAPHIEAGPQNISEVQQPTKRTKVTNNILFPNMSCLVVDDNTVNQRVAMAMLNLLGMRTHLANSGNEALLILAERTFDVILMDINMPDLDGVETTKRIRSGQGTTPIIAVTTNAQPKEQKRFTRAGMNGYVSKPLTKAILKSELEKVLNSGEFLKQTTSKVSPVRSSIFKADQLLSLFSQEKIITQNVVREFMIQAKKGMDQMECALGENDHSATQDYLHTLSGSAFNLRANDFAQACSDLRDRSVENAPPDEIKNALLLTKSSYRILAEELEQFTRS